MTTIPSSALLGISAGFTNLTETNASGTSVSFTGIPSGTKEVVVLFESVSCGTDGDIYIQLGTSSGLEASGYKAAGGYVLQVSTTGVTLSSSSFILRTEGTPNWSVGGALNLFLKDVANNTWIGTVGGRHGNHASNDRQAMVGGGEKSLSSVLTQLSISPQNGSFDGGSMNVMYR